MTADYKRLLRDITDRTYIQPASRNLYNQEINSLQRDRLLTKEEAMLLRSFLGARSGRGPK